MKLKRTSTYLISVATAAASDSRYPVIAVKLNPSSLTIVGRQPVVHAVIAKLQEARSQRPEDEDVAPLRVGENSFPLTTAFGCCSHARRLTPAWRLRHNAANEHSQQHRNKRDSKYPLPSASFIHIRCLGAFLTPGCRRRADNAFECPVEGGLRFVPDAISYLSNREARLKYEMFRQLNAPAGQVSHWRLPG